MFTKVHKRYKKPIYKNLEQTLSVQFHIYKLFSFINFCEWSSGLISMLSLIALCDHVRCRRPKLTRHTFITWFLLRKVISNTCRKTPLFISISSVVFQNYSIFQNKSTDVQNKKIGRELWILQRFEVVSDNISLVCGLSLNRN